MERAMLHYRNLDECRGFDVLTRLPKVEVSRILTPERIEAYRIDMPEGFIFSYAAAPVDGKILDSLQDLADEQQLIEKYKALADGEVMNTGEKRMVLHHLARGQLGNPVFFDGQDLRAFYEGERAKILDFTKAVHAGRIQGSTGKPFAAAVQIGIGGSDLGPRATYIALERWAKAEKRQKMKACFISNVDPDDADQVLRGLDLETSLFILVSKSGTTQETLANETLVRSRLEAAGLDSSRHMVAVTSRTSPLAQNPGYRESFYIDDFIGGRYSTSSAVGGVVLSLAFGSETFAEFLEGAHAVDKAAMEPCIRKNPILLDALIGLYERNMLGMPSTAVLPYAEGLARFPAHLQQLDMESNGKSVNREGKPIAYSTGPVVFGEPGTNGQHSFYQLLHQGTDIVPLQFIGFAENQNSNDILSMGTSSRQKLAANLLAQIVAFARGKEDANAGKRFVGGRPSTLLLGKRLGPRQMGALFAHYENKVMFQGFAWNINSFDQEGVQLGKQLANKMLSIMQGEKADEPVLGAMARLAGFLE
ncbi:MAG: glucose-6-phosphate isomerase [Rectinemataceae bacterium]|nr:glucose-6-phosphate isomerase [Rectinemataceae bacterium]